MNRKVSPYSDPYFAGIGIGVVLLSAYVIVGRGLGASGAFASVAAALTALVYGGNAAAASPAVAPYLTDGIGGALHDWLVLELAGAAVGGFLSVWLGGPNRPGV